MLQPGEFNGMSSQSHVSHCRVLPLGEFIVMISDPHATLQGAVTWRNQCHNRSTLQTPPQYMGNGMHGNSHIFSSCKTRMIRYDTLCYAVSIQCRNVTANIECAERSGSTDTAQTEVRPPHQRHPISTTLAAHSAALGVQDLSADLQMSSPDGTSLP